MKLGEIDLDELVRALGAERSAWIKVASEEGRRHTDAERVTMCVLAALEHIFATLPRT
jgi:hypothetical protein